jgi:hypothetical protein
MPRMQRVLVLQAGPALVLQERPAASLFDYRFLTSSGIVRRQALLPSTVAALEALAPNVALPTDPLDLVRWIRYLDSPSLDTLMTAGWWYIQLIALPPPAYAV